MQKTQADISKTRADTLLTAAKIPQVAQQTLHTAHQTNADGSWDEQADADTYSYAVAAGGTMIRLLPGDGVWYHPRMETCLSIRLVSPRLER